MKDTENKLNPSLNSRHRHAEELQRNLNRQREKAKRGQFRELKNVWKGKELADPKYSLMQRRASLGKEHQELMEKYEQVFYHWEQLNQR